MAERGMAARLQALEWDAIERALDERGYARTPPLLTAGECRALVALWRDPQRFRSRVDMARQAYGVGEYRYFKRPLPHAVQQLRTHLYPPLARIANRWHERLGRPPLPPTLAGFLAVCHDAGQMRPTPLLLHYRAEGYNRLHRDLYGAVAFPLQVTVFLSRRGDDYEGGEFLLLEQRPRQQSRAEAIPGDRGELLVFPNAERPVASRRGFARAQVRHGLSRVTQGERFALGVIFHDAR